MYNIRQSLASVVFLIASLASAGSAAELVTNGGFEAPPVVNVGVGYDYVSALPGWTINAPNNGLVLFNANYRPVGDGLQSIQLEYPGDWIEQSIATVANQNYVLSFLLSAWAPAGAGLLSVLDVEIDSNPVVQTTFPGTSASYALFSVPFIAAGALTTLHFENGGLLGTYPHLDNVSVTAVPEPATLALLGLALLGLGYSRRRKQ